MKPTMQTLANGKNNKAILKLLRILINTSQSNFGDLNLDDNCIRDIADIITAETPEGVASANDYRDSTAEIERPRGAILADDGAFFEKHGGGAAAQQEESKQ